MLTFLILDIDGYLLCIAIESAILTVISGAFLANILVRTGHQDVAK